MLKRILILSALLQELLQFALGVDYGGEFHKASMILPGKYFYMVENQISKKKTPTIVAFCSGDRSFENTALKKFLKKSCDSFSYPTRFLYAKINDEAKFNSEIYLDDNKVSKDKFGYLLEVSKSNLPESLNFTRTGSDDKHYYLRTEEINAMILENNVINAGTTGNTVFREGVVTIPSNDLSVEARKRIKATNELAGFKVLGLIHENTAAALYYSMDREPNNENILVINIGSSNTKLVLINHRNDTIKTKYNTTETLPSVVVIDDIYTDKVSGHAIDTCMSDYALNKFVDGKPNKDSLLAQVDLYKKRRLASDIQRPKEILSVNKESSLTMEDFFGYSPLTVQVVKTEFETNCKYITEELEKLLIKFEKKLAKHNLSKENISAIEIIGGSTRVPFIQDKLKEFYGMKLYTRINGDDGPALGATFLAGNYTVGVRTKRILLTDGPNYPVHVSVRFDNQTQVYKDTELFHRKTRFGTKKTLSIQNLDTNTHIQLYTTEIDNYYRTYLIKDVKRILDNYKTKNITEWKATLSFEIDTLGIPSIKSADLLIKQNITEVVNVTVSKNSTNSTNTTEKEYKTETRNYIKTSKEKLIIEDVDESYKSLLDDKAEFEISKKLLKDLREFEEQKKALSAEKNTLESYIYKLKTIADSKEHNIYLSDEERVSYHSKSAGIDEFFMSDDFSASNLHHFKNRTKDIEEFMNQYEYRKEEHRNRHSIFTKALDALNKTSENVSTIQKLRSWIPIEKIEEANERIIKAQDDIRNSYTDQIATPLHINPKFTYNYVSQIMEELKGVLTKLRSIEKPKKPVNATEGLDELIDKMGKFNFTDPSMDPEKLKELLKNMKNNNISMEDLLKADTNDKNGEEATIENSTDESKDGVPEATEGQEEYNTNHEASIDNQDTIESEAESSSENSDSTSDNDL